MSIHRTISNSVSDQPPTTSPGTESKWHLIWQDNKGMIFVLLAQLFGTWMDATVRLLETTAGDGHGMHPFQVLFARMSITFVISSIYMWWMSVPYFPLGKPEVRGWLVLRALFGFGGVYALYYSVHYLPLAEAIVIRFLIPIITCWACSVFLNETFTRKEQLAGLISLIGVVVIAHPASIFGRDEKLEDSVPTGGDDVTPTQRLIAIIFALIGVFGGSGAYTIIRVIGPRAHALISVNYFAGLTTAASAIFLLTIPSIGFKMPAGAHEWILLISLGVLGFFMQFLLTAGLQLDRSSKTTSMIYTQVLFALIFDWAIWGILPGLWSIIGGSIVIVSTLWIALQKTQKKSDKTEDGKQSTIDEESALLGDQTEGAEEVAVRRASVGGSV